MVIGKCYSKVPLNQNGKLAEVDLPPIEKGCCSITSPSGTEKCFHFQICPGRQQ